MKDEKIKLLEGKTILLAWFEGIKKYDDIPFLYLKFTTGEIVRIVATHGGYTGKSEDEYPNFIKIQTMEEE